MNKIIKTDNIGLNIIAGIVAKIDKSADNQHFTFNQHCAETPPQLRQAIHVSCNAINDDSK